MKQMKIKITDTALGRRVQQEKRNAHAAALHWSKEERDDMRRRCDELDAVDAAAEL